MQTERAHYCGDTIKKILTFSQTAILDKEYHHI